MDSLKALFIVVNAGFVDEAVEIARAQGAKGATILNARGESLKHKSFMGITIDSEKEIVLTIVEKNVATKIMAGIKENIGIHTPAHAVCFFVPVERMTETQSGMRNSAPPQISDN